MSTNTRTPAIPPQPAPVGEPPQTAPAQTVPGGEVSPDLARRRAAAEEIAQRIAAFKRVAPAGMPVTDGNPVVPGAPVADVPAPVPSSADSAAPADPQPRPLETGAANAPVSNPASAAARNTRHPFVQAYAISQASRRRQADAADPDPAPPARPARLAPSRPGVGETRRPSPHGTDISASMRARDAARAEAAWARADEAKVDPARLDAARAEAIEARAARMEAARRRQAEAQVARRDDSHRDEAERHEMPADSTWTPATPEVLTHAASTDEPRVDEIPLDEASAVDSRSEPQWAPIAQAPHAPSRLWLRAATGLVVFVAIAATALGGTFIWQLRDSGPNTQPAILAASERAADELAGLLAPTLQPDVSMAPVIAGSNAPAPDEPTPELAAIPEPPSAAPETSPPVIEPETETSVSETPATPLSDVAPPEMAIVLSAPAANHPPATRPGASRPAALLSQLPDSEAIGDAPIVPPPTPDASGQAVTPQPLAQEAAAPAKPKPQLTAKPKPTAEKAAVVPAAAKPVAQPASKHLAKPAKPAAKPAKASKTPEPVKQILDALAPFMNGSKPQQPEQGNRK